MIGRRRNVLFALKIEIFVLNINECLKVAKYFIDYEVFSCHQNIKNNKGLYLKKLLWKNRKSSLRVFVDEKSQVVLDFIQEILAKTT
jgi:hypothetical protein